MEYPGHVESGNQSGHHQSELLSLFPHEPSQAQDEQVQTVSGIKQKLPVNLPRGNGGSLQLGSKDNQKVVVPEARAHMMKRLHVMNAAVTLSYRECNKNHAVNIGGVVLNGHYVLDGCQEFMPGADGDMALLHCVACGCHRSFHRLHVLDEVLSNSKLNHAAVLSKSQSVGAGTTTTTKSTPKTTMSTPTTTMSTSMTTTSTPTTTMTTMRSLGEMAQPVEDSPERWTRQHEEMLQGKVGSNSDEGMMMSMPSTSHRKFTKFTTQQSDQMRAFADKIGWYTTKYNRAATEEFCASLGITSVNLKNWMRNRRYAKAMSKP